MTTKACDRPWRKGRRTELTITSSGWSVPCVSIQLTLSQHLGVSIQLTLSQHLVGTLWGTLCVDSTHVLTLSQHNIDSTLTLSQHNTLCVDSTVDPFSTIQLVPDSTDPFAPFATMFATAPVCPVFRVVVAGRYLVCRFN